MPGRKDTGSILPWLDKPGFADPMTPTHRAIAALRKLRRLHGETGSVPLAELDVLIAELETEEDEPPADRPRLGLPTELDLNPHGFPRGLARP
jgi:hypothetical protein